MALLIACFCIDLLVFIIRVRAIITRVPYLLQIEDVTVEVVEGDARRVLCEAVEKHHASILVVGSHGYGAIKR